MNTELTPEDRERIEQEARERVEKHIGLPVEIKSYTIRQQIIGAEYENKYQREKQEGEKRCVYFKCYLTGKCQETEGFKGTEHEGLDMCEDGCVFFDPKIKDEDELKALWKEVEAERTELRNKVNTFAELLHQCMQESDDLSLRLLTEIKQELNSLKTK